MPATTCSQCRRANPAGAAFCYFDGTLLNGHGAAGPVAVRHTFANPFVFPSGRQCRTFDELALACHEEWDEARGLLSQGYLERFLVSIGRTDLARVARDAAKAADQDCGLDDLLDKLPTDVLQPPLLHIGMTEVNLGTLTVGTDRHFELRLQNQGMRLLQGSVTCDEAPWLSLGDGAGTNQKLFQFSGSAVIPVNVVGQRLRAGNKPLEGQLVLDSNGGSFAVNVRAAVPIKPFPDGVLRGAVTPRQIAERAKAAPKEAAPYFENAAVARWYTDNGWVYPVQGPAASGLGAVQQFFEALGLTPPPRVEINTRAVSLAGNVGQRLDYILQVATAEKRAVYAHAVSDQPWLTVGRANLQGRLATIPIVIPAVPDRPGERLQARVTVTANGNQHFPVAVSLAVAGQTGARRPSAILEVKPQTSVTGFPVAAPVVAIPVAMPVERPPSRLDTNGRPGAEPAPPQAVPAKGNKKSARKHLVPLGALILGLLAVLGVDAFRGRPEPVDPVPVPVAIDDSIDPDPLIEVRFHAAEEKVTLAVGGTVKPGEGANDSSDSVEAIWEPSMRFGVVMLKENDPKRGGPKRLTYQDDGTTNNTVVLLDHQSPPLASGGQGWIFGERPFRRTRDGRPEGPDWHGHWKKDERDVPLPADARRGPGRKSVWVYDREKVTVTQFVQVVPGEQSRKLDTCLVRYVIENGDTRDHRVGLRFMLDTFIGGNDGVPFTIPGEKKLCDTTKVFRTPNEVPDFIEALERESLTDPGTVARLQLRLGGRIESPDRVTLGAWPNPELSKPPHNDRRCQQEKTLWDVPIFPIKTLDPADSCVTMYWDERALGPGERREVGFAYGLGNVASDTDAAGRLGLSVGGSFKPGGEFTLTALVSNPQRGETLSLELPAGFQLTDSEATQKVPEVPAEAARRTSPVTWKIRAGGEGGYTLTVRSSSGAAQALPVRIRSTSIFD
jgi:hypothetical protein